MRSSAHSVISVSSSGHIMPPSALLVLGTANRKKAPGAGRAFAARWDCASRRWPIIRTPSVSRKPATRLPPTPRSRPSSQARHLNAWVLGEDSGLAVDALGGRTGHFFGPLCRSHATDEQNNERLLAELGDVPLPRRTAHYVCHCALSDPSGPFGPRASARCHGRIRFEPAGTGGFGYDPLFEIVEYHRTFGEFGQSVKAVLSHRARAVEKLLPQLIELCEAG